MEMSLLREEHVITSEAIDPVAFPRLSPPEAAGTPQGPGTPRGPGPTPRDTPIPRLSRGLRMPGHP